MNLVEEIIRLAKELNSFNSADIQNRLPKKVSRQFISRTLNVLVQQGALAREGSGRWTKYVLATKTHLLTKRVGRNFPNRDLQDKEYEVLHELTQKAPFLNELDENVRSIFDYGFTEMLNNAIEHSRSERIHVEVEERDATFQFKVRDYGVGVFNNVMEKKSLPSEFAAIQDLLKGKTTTAPQAHSGEGIFFTSKAADVFVLESHGYRLRVDNQIEDVFVEEVPKKLKGTDVSFEIGAHSTRHLSDVFKRYQTDPQRGSFDKTEFYVKLFTLGTVYVSRSQARRLLTGLEKFKLVTLDFDRVPTIGQAFADEIFRVFPSRFPDTKIVPTNTNKAVQFMLDRVGPPQPELFKKS